MKIVIAGAGKLGLKVAEALLGGDNDVTLIDKNADLLQKINSQFDLLTINANAKRTDILKEIEVEDYDYMIAVTDSDEKNMVICSLAKKLGCPKTIARIRDPEHANQIDFIKDTFQIDYIVNPDMSIAKEISKYLVIQYSFSNGVLPLGNVALLEFAAEKLPVIIDKNIHDISRILEHTTVVGVSRNGKIIIPDWDTVVLEEDTLYIVGETNEINKINTIVHEKQEYTNLKKAMIVGGGKTGFFLAQLLDDFGISVKIIEINKERCEYLAENLNDVLVLHGDATDPNLLLEENLAEMDAFITVTGFDEDNLLLALMAKQNQVDEVVAKISRKSYSGLIETLGIDMALNPSDITASAILRFVQGSKHIISSRLIQGQAEFIEVLATEGMPLLDAPIGALDLPEDLIIAAVIREDEIIIPDGNTEMKEGDKIIIFFLLSDIPAFEKFLKEPKRRLF